MEEELNIPSESGFVAGDIPSGTNEPLLIPLASNGTTCEVFRKIYAGKTTFIKRLRKEYIGNPTYYEIFRKEYENGKQLDCPYIVRCENYVDDGDDCYIEMEYVEGETLKERLLTNPGYFADKRNLDKFLLQLLEGLRCLHTHQVVHLDLKPDNIMLSKVNNDVKILDLGYCYSDTFQTTIGRNLAYAAPEQLDGSCDVDARTDIYAVGKLLEHILSTVKISRSRKYKKIIRRCIHKEKSERYQDVSEIIDLLDSGNQYRWLIICCIVIAACAIIYNKVNIHRLVYGYDFSDYALCYNIISEEDKTCELVKYDPSLVKDGKGDVVIKDAVEYRGEVYKVKSVLPQTFMNDTTITKLSILSNDIHFGDEVFRYCSSLSSVYVNDDFNSFSQGLFGCCLSLESFRFPSAMTEVMQACFHKTALKEISLPDGVKAIHQDAFCDCDNLTEIALPPNLKTLERGVFYQCDNLREVTLPASVNNIGQYCFMECPNLKAIYNYSPTPQRVSEIFDTNTHIIVYVPKKSVDLYKQSDCWKDQDIQPME